MAKYSRLTTISTSLILACAAGTVSADFPKTEFGMEHCLQAALVEKNGGIVKVELKTENGVPTYEYDIETSDGKAWDIECNTQTGKISEIEQEVKSADDPLFKSKVKVDEKTARQTALNAHPGNIIEVEYEVEPDGSASYEFDIKTKENTEIKLEIDATTGKIVEDNVEIYQIGSEE